MQALESWSVVLEAVGKMRGRGKNVLGVEVVDVGSD